MNKILTEKNKHFIEQNAWMIAGNIIFAIGVNVIINPIGLYNGGFMGLSQLLRLFCLNVLHLSVPEGIDLVGIIYFLVNAPLFILGYKIVGKKFCVKSVI